MTHELAKKAAGEEAAKLIQNGMTVGLGTGSTAKYFIEALASRVKEGLSVTCIATSKETERLSLHLGLKLNDSLTEIDIDVDGADQIDEKKNMIKGGGGALLREKIIAHSSKEMIVLIDPSKQKKHLGGIALPVEILPFGAPLTLLCIEKLGLTGILRKKDDSLFLTDNMNYIFDIELKTEFDPETLNRNLLKIPGVLETGLFLKMAGRVIIGKNDGTVSVY